MIGVIAEECGVAEHVQIFYVGVREGELLLLTVCVCHHGCLPSLHCVSTEQLTITDHRAHMSQLGEERQGATTC